MRQTPWHAKEGCDMGLMLFQQGTPFELTQAVLYILRELESCILRDTPKPWHLKAPGPKLTIEQLEEAKGNGSP